MEFKRLFWRGGTAEIFGVLGMTALVVGAETIIQSLAGWSLAIAPVTTVMWPVLAGVMAIGVGCMLIANAIKTYGAARDKAHEEAHALGREQERSASRAPQQEMAVPAPAVESRTPEMAFADRYLQEKSGTAALGTKLL